MPDEGTEKSVTSNMLAPESGAKVEAATEAAPEKPLEMHGADMEEPEPQPKEQEHPASPPQPPEPAPAPAPAAAPPAKDKAVVDVENILASGLEAMYTQLPDAKKTAFRQKGEEVARAIVQMFQTGRVKVHAILDAIRDWLRMIPGVNKFFLEQEAKIKTDRVLAYGEKASKEQTNEV